MIAIALVDNGSLEPAATMNLRRVAAEISAQAGTSVAPVSWKHSDRINPQELENTPALTLRPWLEERLALGTREFLFLPFFISAQGAIGSALRTDVENILGHFPDAHASFAEGVSSGERLALILRERIQACCREHALAKPAVVVVDHGGPSPASAALRNNLAREMAEALGSEVLDVRAASMEGENYPHAQPLLADVLRSDDFPVGPTIIALLFLSPGRHAGAGGDLAQIVAAAEAEIPGRHCYFTELIGTHPLMTECLVDSLQRALSAFSAFGSA